MTLPKPYYEDSHATLYHGNAVDVLRSLPEHSVHTCVTSPPYYGLRDYGVPGQLGLEETPEQYIENMVAVFREVRRVLRDDGTLWVNIGDSYAQSGKGGNPDESPHRKQATNTGSLIKGSKVPPGYKPKDLIGIPWMLAFALRADGWYLRSDIIWSKPNPMPESVTDRPTKAHEYVFLLSKSKSYHYDADAVREPHNPDGRRVTRYNGSLKYRELPNAGTLRVSGTERCPGDGRNRRSVWTVTSQPFPGAHFAVYPSKLIEPCILAGAPEGGVVLDPFVGSGTTCITAKRLSRRSVGIDLSESYLREHCIPRLSQQGLIWQVPS